MKIKHGFISTALIGFFAGAVRILQYILTIDEEGYYIGGALSNFLEGVLAGLLICGIGLGILLGAMQQKTQVALPHHFAKSTPPRVLFLLIAAVFLADGIWRLAAAGSALDRIIGILCVGAALNWGLLGLQGKLVPVLSLLPILQAGALIIDYFWRTYKYIQVSEYAIGILGLCALAYFILALMKAMTGADCSECRLARSGFCLTVLSFAAFMAPLASELQIGQIFLALEGLLFSLLAALILIWLPEKPAVHRQTAIPDPAVLKEYISDLPEIQEENEEE